MAISTFDMFKIGIGPSSSHTMGPMRAANRFIMGLEEHGNLALTKKVRVELYGSLALTGVGHGTDKALQLGLESQTAEAVDPDYIEPRLAQIKSDSKLRLAGKHEIAFSPQEDLVFKRRETLPLHSNGMRFFALDENGAELHQQTYYSIGGGFVVNEETAEQDRLKKDASKLPYDFSSGAEMIRLAEENKMRVCEMMLANEKVWRDEADVLAGLDAIWAAMQGCVERGCKQEGVLPGPMKVKRRAPHVYRSLTSTAEHHVADPLTILDWVNLYALAVNEENACGARVVTAPTNGAAGILPAVMTYYDRFCRRSDPSGIHTILLTAAAIGILYTANASISGAEVGCQGEVGVACSMAAAGLTAAMGGTVRQVEQAAEIGMEHNLGLTCDPIGGLVQIPCIERNAMGAIKAINASRIALRGDGEHFVSLDSVIKTMRQTGEDMQTKYKETSRGGLAVNVTEC